jgi:GABA(A) receptor-associated protein
MRISK